MRVLEMVDAKIGAEARPVQSRDVPLVRIYVLRDPRDGAVRYVGKTSKPLDVRYGQHTGRAANRRSDTRCARWIRALAAAGLRPEMEQIEIAGADWAEREAYWIAHYRALGARLTNLTAGGDGAAGLRMTPEQRAKVKAARACPEWRAATSSRLRSMWADPETRRARSAVTKAAKNQPETRARASARMLAYWSDPEARERQSESTKAQWTAHRRKAQTAANKARWSDPDWRAQTVAKMRAAARGKVERRKHAPRADGAPPKDSPSG